MHIKVIPNSAGRWMWTWMVIDDRGFPVTYGWCYGQKRAARKAGRLIRQLKETTQ